MGNPTPLYVAAKKGYIACVKELIQAGADLNAGTWKGDTPLMVAAQKGHIDCVEELIRAGADTSAVDGNGKTPLMEAAQSFSFDCVAPLLEAGAEIDTTYLAFMAASFVPLQNSKGTVHNTYQIKRGRIRIIITCCK